MKNRTQEASLHPLLDLSVDEEPAIAVPDTAAAAASRTADPADHRLTLGILAIMLGIGALVIAWWGVSGTTDIVDQLSYIGTGMCAGTCLLVLGTVLIVAREHARDREAFQEIIGRLEERLAGEFDHLDRLVRSDDHRRL